MGEQTGRKYEIGRRQRGMIRGSQASGKWERGTVDSMTEASREVGR